MRIFYLFLLFLLAGCGPNRDLVYFSNLEEEDLNAPEAIENVVIPTIQPDDLLSITVNSLSAETNLLFNQGVLGTLGSEFADGQRTTTKIEGYLVDREGYINFPVIGKIKVGGLTKAAATDTIRNILDREYVEDPTINIRFLNFKVTLIGEVTNPSTITIPTEKLNIIEALSMAGDLTTIGKRENILIIREKDGVRKLYRVNLNDKDLIYSPNYYLQQNDIVYVEPDKIKAAQSSLRRQNIQFIISTSLGIITIATLILTLDNR